MASHLTILAAFIVMLLIVPSVGGLAVNVALGKIARQSTTWPGGDASHAVDGNLNGDFYQGSCTSTNRDDPAPWLRIELGNTFTVTSVALTNRDGGAGKHFHDLEILVTSDPAQTTSCAFVSGPVGEGLTALIQCTQALSGRFVTIRSVTGDYLTLCEVQVFGTEDVVRQ